MKCAPSLLDVELRGQGAAGDARRYLARGLMLLERVGARMRRCYLNHGAKMRHSIVMFLGWSIFVGACSGAEPGAGDSAADTLAVASVNADSPSSAGNSPGKAPAAESAGHAHAGEGEGQALLLIMQQLGTNMTSLTYGLMTDDAATVTRSAAAIAEHAPIAPAELERIHRELGPEMAEFERLDEAVHTASVRLHQAAEAGLAQEVLTRLNEVQRGCVACHVKFRARLKTAPAR